MGPRAGLDKCGKSRPPPAFDGRTVQPVASRYTDCAIPVRNFVNAPKNTLKFIPFHVVSSSIEQLVFYSQTLQCFVLSMISA